MVKEIVPAQVITHLNGTTIVDVRSPAEYDKGHIPGAINLPLFNNEERKIIGTLYHQYSSDEAFQKGLELAGSKLSGYVRDIRLKTVNKNLLIYCWRGGMRSESLSNLLSISGFDVLRLSGGYKAFRNFMLKYAGNQYRFIVIGGMTGSGKSSILREIGKKGFRILDIEEISSHKGSVFGHLGQTSQPTNEQFENDIFFKLNALNNKQPVWVEDESRSIGSNQIPESIFNTIIISPLILIELSKTLRVKRLVHEYARFDPSMLQISIEKISKRLGDLNTRLAKEAILQSRFDIAAGIALDHYDKAYTFSVNKRKPETVYRLKTEKDDPERNADLILEFAGKCGLLN